MALPLLLLAKETPVFLSSYRFVQPRPLFPIRQAQCVQAFLLKAWAILQALHCCRQHQQDYRYHFFPALPFTLLLWPRYAFLFCVLLWISHYVPHLAGKILFLLFYPARMGPGSFISSRQWYSRWVGQAQHAASAIYSSMQSLSAPNNSSLCKDWRPTVASKFFNTQDPLVSTEEPVVTHLARCGLSRIHCNGHNLLLNSYLSTVEIAELRILLAASAVIRPRTSFISLCTLSTDSTTLAFWRLLSIQHVVQTLGNYLDSGTPWSPAMPPSLWRGRATTTTVEFCSNLTEILWNHFNIKDFFEKMPRLFWNNSEIKKTEDLFIDIT